MVKKEEIELSPTYYDRLSEKWGEYKVIKVINKLKTYLVKFKDSQNEREVSYKSIIENKVIDLVQQKKESKKRARSKVKVEKDIKYEVKHNFKNITNEYVLLSIDASSHSSGVSIFINGKLIHYDYIYQSHSIKNDTQRINFMKNEIVKLINKYNVTHVAIEDVISLNKVALYVLSKLQGVILDYCYYNNIDAIKISVLEWKSAMGLMGYGSRELGKEATVDKANKIFNIDLRSIDSPLDLSEPCYFDLGDSLIIGKYCVDNKLK